MAKITKRLQKNMKVVKEKEKKEYPLKNQIIKFSKIIYSLLIIAVVLYAITVISNKTYKIKEDSLYDSSQILAGQTFSKLEEEYYVVFYDTEEKENIENKIDSISNQVIYKVDLSLKSNQFVISEKGYADAENVEELKINGPTIIKIKDGKNYEYVEGYDNVINYLENM